VAAQVEIGSYAAKRAASFLKKLALAQEEYSRQINKLVAHEQIAAAATLFDLFLLPTTAGGVPFGSASIRLEGIPNKRRAATGSQTSVSSFP